MRQLVVKSAGEVCALRWDGSEISISLHFLFLVKCPRGLSSAVVLVLDQEWIRSGEGSRRWLLKKCRTVKQRIRFSEERKESWY